MEDDLEAIFGPVIHQVSREQLLEEGILVDVSPLARQAGFRFPVAVSHAIWTEYVQVPQGVIGQDETGRLWDILSILSLTIRSRRTAGDTVSFEVLIRNDNRQARLVGFKALCGPGDHAEPVITILLPDED